MPTFEYDRETIIYYETHGTGDRPVLLIHGFGDTSETWENIVPFIEAGRRIFIVDLRGCGLSSKPRDRFYSVEDHVRIFLAFLRELGLERVSLIGHSMGGAIALRLALTLTAQNPRMLERLVLIDAAGLPQKIPDFVQIPALPFIGPLILYGVPARLQAFFTIRPLYKVPGSYRKSRSLRYARSLRSPGGVSAVVMTARALIAEKNAVWTPELLQLNCPTLILWGKLDPAIPVDNARIFMENIKDAEMTILPPCGHVPQEEQPHVVGPLLDSFLAH